MYEVIKEVIKEVAVPAPVPEKPARVDAEIQTSLVPVPPGLYSGLNLPSSLLAQRRLRYLSSAPTATTTVLQAVKDEDEDVRPELAYVSKGEPRTEVETDAINYHQGARSSALTPSVTNSTESVNDDNFHSMSTTTDNDYSDEKEELDETKSLRASVLSRVSRATSPHTATEKGPKTTKRYESTGVSTDLTDPIRVPTVIHSLVEENNLSKIAMSVQMDEWAPPPQIPPEFGPYRVGQISRRFQFVSSSPAGLAIASNGMPSTSTPSMQLAHSLRDTTNTFANRPMRFVLLPGEDGIMSSVDSTTEFGQRQLKNRHVAMIRSVTKLLVPT